MTSPWTRTATFLAIGVLLAVAGFVATSGHRSVGDAKPANEGEPAATPEHSTVVKPASIEAPILVYHNIRPRSEAPANVDEAYDMTPEEFEAHLRYLKDNGYAAVTQRDLGSMLDGAIPVPEKPVLLGFDDGRATQMTYAVPLLEQYGFAATFYVFTNAIGRDGYLTEDDLLRIETAGHEIASHTVFHPFLTKISDPAELEREVAGSKRVLDAQLRQPVASMAYPFGLSDETVVAAVKAAGYTTARGLRHTALQTDADRYDLGGYIVTGPLPQLISVLGSAR